MKSIPRQFKDTQIFQYKTPISFSHLWGAMTGYITKYILAPFNDGYIRTVWNGKAEPFEQRSQSFKDVFLKPRPTLFINPKFDPMDESKFRPVGEFDNDVPNLPTDDIGLLNGLPELIADEKFALYYRLQRYKLEYDMNFAFDSDVQRIQAQNLLRTKIRHRLPSITHTYLECSIPTEYIKAIADTVEMDVNSEKFEMYLNTLSKDPIVRRFRTGSGNFEWFVNLQTVLDIETNMSSGGSSRRGNLVIESGFSENVVVEFAAPAIYMLSLDSDIVPEEPKTEESANKMDVVAIDKVAVMSLPVGDDVLGDYTKYRMITIQPDKDGEDSVNLYDLIEDQKILRFLDLYKENGLVQDFVYVLVYEEVMQLNPDRIFLDNNLTLTIKNMSMYNSYYVNIYVDYNKLNGIQDDLFNNTKEER